MVHQHTILIVDDDEPIRSLAQRVLTRARFAVDTAKDGVEALEKLDLVDYDVVLLDLMMPRMSGFDVISELQKNAESKLRCVVVMTAATNAQLDRFDGNLVYTVLRKPFDIDELTRVVDACAVEAKAARKREA